MTTPNCIDNSSVHETGTCETTTLKQFNVVVSHVPVSYVWDMSGMLRRCELVETLCAALVAFILYSALCLGETL